MKVLVDCRPVRSPFSGVGRYCANLVNALAANTDNDYTAYCQNLHSNEYLRQLRPSVRRIGTSAGPRLTKLENLLHEYVPLASSQLVGHAFDVIHETYFARLGSARNARKKVATIHDTISIDYPSQYSSRNAFYSRRNLMRQSREADEIICVSEYTRGRVLSLTECDPKKISVVGCGVDPIDISISDVEATLRQLSLQSPYVLYVGNIEPRKNLTVLFDAWSMARKRLPEYKLVVAGRYNYLGKPIIEYGQALLGSSFVYLGGVSDKDKAALLRGARLFVFPSLYEGYGIPVIEAYSAGCPCIFSDSTALRELSVDDRQMFSPLSAASIAEKMLECLEGRGGWIHASRVLQIKQETRLGATWQKKFLKFSYADLQPPLSSPSGLLPARQGTGE